MILLMTGVNAQESEQDHRFNFMVHAGLNASQVGGDGLSGFNKLNPAVGIGVRRNLDDRFSLRLELNYLQKGSRKVADPENNDLTEYKMSLSYVQVAPLFQYNHNPKFSLIAGPALGFLLSSKEEDFLGEIANNPDFEPIDLSAILSLQYHLSNRFSAELRYDQSLLPIRRRDAGSTRNLVGRQFNTVLGIMLSYSID
jgi:hypothetical protein